jgi:hypothetical protein
VYIDSLFSTSARRRLVLHRPDLRDVLEELEARPRLSDQRLELLARERDDANGVLAGLVEDARAKLQLVIDDDRDRGQEREPHQRVEAGADRREHVTPSV